MSKHYEKIAEFLESIGWRSNYDPQWANLRDSLNEIRELLQASPAPDGEVVAEVTMIDRMGAPCIQPYTAMEVGTKLYTAPPRVVDGLLRESAEIITELCNAYGHPFPQATLDRIQAALEKP